MIRLVLGACGVLALLLWWQLDQNTALRADLNAQRASHAACTARLSNIDDHKELSYEIENLARDDLRDRAADWLFESD